MNNLDERIRTLDPATGVSDETAAIGRDTLFARIVATDPGADGRGSSRPLRRPGWSRSVPLRFAAGGVVAVAATAVLVLPGPGGGSAAFASWTPEPSAVTGVELDRFAEACEDAFAPDQVGDPFLAERRGDFVAVLFRVTDPERSSTCLVQAPVGGDIEQVSPIGASGGSGPMYLPPAGQITGGAISQFEMAGEVASFTDGAVGDDVVGVTIHSDGQTVEATVKDGQYAAWWPGRAVADVDAPNGQEPEDFVLISYDVTLADGRVLKDVDLALPS